MQQISDLIKISLAELDQARSVWMRRRPFCPHLAKNEFLELLIAECSIRLLNRGDDCPFIIDKENKDVIEYLYQYLIGSEDQFSGNLYKGLMMAGPIGTGKTILLRGFSGVISRVTDRKFEYYSAFDLNRLIVKEGIEKFSRKPLLIDDLGKEQESVKDYGTEVRPILELFASRYDSGALTFITTNYNNETFTKKYGQQTVDRFRESFNVIQLTGKSRRR